MCEISELLNQILEQTKPDNNVIWIAAISSLSTLVAAGIGALLLYRGTLAQIKSTNAVEEKKITVSIVTTERLRWLQDLRQQSCKFYANLDMQYNLLKRSVSSEDQAKVQEKLDELSEKTMMQSNMICTMLNPKRENQQDMRSSSQKALEQILICFEERGKGSLKFDDQEYKKIKESFFDSLTKVGTETWNQVRELT